MTASEIVGRARELADLKKTAFIEHGDEMGSVNESWRDVYSVLTDSDDDYFIEEAIFTLSTYSIGLNEWLIPLPVDFYKVRAVDISSSTLRWVSVDKFPHSARNHFEGSIRYRFKGRNLWLIGSQSAVMGGQIRLRYYPPPAWLQVPAAPIMAGYGKTYAQIAALASPCYVAERGIMLYADGNNIIAEDVRTHAVTVLYAGASPSSFIRYYRGSIYYIRGGSIYTAATELTAVFVPAAIVGPANVISLEVWGQALYYCENPAGFNTYRRPIGGAAVLLGAFQSSRISEYRTGYLYINGAGVIVDQAAVSTGIAATGLATDEAGNVYTLEGQTVRKRTFDALLAPVSSYDLYTDGGALGPYDGERLAVTAFEKSAIFALSSFEDSDLDYPLNIVPEVIAYQSALDYKRKQGGDITALAARLEEKRRLMVNTIRRDEYENDRINNFYGERWR